MQFSPSAVLPGILLLTAGMLAAATPDDADEITRLGVAEDFARFGGFMTAHKYLPATRTGDSSEARWDAIRSDEELALMRERGEFLDMWQWRAHRSHPVGKADNGFVLHYRLSAEAQHTQVPVFCPGQVTWQWLHGPDHPGQSLTETTPIGIRDVAELHPLDDLVEWIQALEREGELPEEVQR